MKFTVASYSLRSALEALARVTPRKLPFPALGHVHALLTDDGNLTLSATDLEVTLSQVINCSTIEPGTALFPCQSLLNLTKNLDESLIIEVSKRNKITITTQSGAVVTLGSEKVDDYPQLPSLQNPTTFNLDNSTLHRAISKTLPFVSHDELRPQLTGLLFNIKPDSITFVATDGHRLAKLKLQTQTGVESSLILPQKAAALLERFLKPKKKEEPFTVDISFEFRSADDGGYESAQASFSFGNSTLISRLIGGHYPTYECCIPQSNDKTLLCDKEALTSCLSRVGQLANDVSHQVKFFFNGACQLSSEDFQARHTAQETFPGQWTAPVPKPSTPVIYKCEECGKTEGVKRFAIDGVAWYRYLCGNCAINRRSETGVKGLFLAKNQSDPDPSDFEIGFNAAYVLSALRQIDTSEIKWYFGTKTSASIMQPSFQEENENLLYLLMPVRLD